MAHDAVIDLENPDVNLNNWSVQEGTGRRKLLKTHLTISKPVLQRMIDGKTLGIAIKPLGSINASFDAMENEGGEKNARLLFNVTE